MFSVIMTLASGASVLLTPGDGLKVEVEKWDGQCCHGKFSRAPFARLLAFVAQHSNSAGQLARIGQEREEGEANSSSSSHLASGHNAFSATHLPRLLLHTVLQRTRRTSCTSCTSPPPPAHALCVWPLSLRWDRGQWP